MLQAAPPSLRRCRIIAGGHGIHSTGTVGKQQTGLSLRWEKEENNVFETWPPHNSASVAELSVAVRDFAEARGIAVTLEDDGRCVVFDRT